MFSAKKFALTRTVLVVPAGGTTDVQAFAQTMLTTANMSAPASGGALTLNGVSLGSYDYIVKQGSQTISSFTSTDWFTATQDTRSAWIVINGDLIINSGVTVIPAVRKLFTVVYVFGNLVLNGTISMSKRGANHSGSGGAGTTTAAAIRVATGTFNAVTNPTIAATGGAGGASNTSGAAANGGSPSGSVIGSGGGGGGAYGGAGAAGTCFSGGPGGGAEAGGGAGGANGGAGGWSAGVGNPSAGGNSNNRNIIEEGTGGTLIVIVFGAVSGAGSLTANGGNTVSDWISPNPNSNGQAGGASGGGVVVLLRQSGSVTMQANGGTSSGLVNGGAGGAGSAVAFTLP